MVGAVAEPHPFELFHCHDVAPASRHSLIVERQCNVFNGIFVIDQVERLEYEANHAVAQFGGAVFAEILDQRTVEDVFSGVVVVEDADNVQQR